MFPIMSYVGLGILFCGLVVANSRPNKITDYIIGIGLTLAGAGAVGYAIGKI